MLLVCFNCALRRQNLGERSHLITQCGQVGLYVMVTPIGGQETCAHVWKKSNEQLLSGLAEENQKEIGDKIESSWCVSSG